MRIPLLTSLICLALCPLSIPQSGHWGVVVDWQLDQATQSISPSIPTTLSGSQPSNGCGFSSEYPIYPGTGMLSGFVRDALSQEPIPGVFVQVCGFGRGNAAQYPYEVYAQGQAMTDDSGYFSVSNLPTTTNQGPLSYSIIMSPLLSSHPTYEILPMTGVVVTDTTQLNTVLGPGGTISGVITDEYSGSPLSGVKVYANFEAPPSQSSLLWLSTVSDSSGHYTLTNLSTYTYALFFAPPDPLYVWEIYPEIPNYYSDLSHVGHPYRMPIAAGRATNGIDASLERYARVGGSVTIATSTQPVSGTMVRVFPRDPSLFSPFSERSYITDEHGRYMAFVPSGSYRVFFKPPASSGYPCQYYFDYTQPDQYPLDVQVQQPESILGINSVLRRPGRITGHVRYHLGRGVPTAIVHEWHLPDLDCNVFNAGYAVGEDGSFELPNLVPRHYHPVAEYRAGNFIFYSFPVGSPNDTIVVREGETVSGVEFVFPDPIYLPMIRGRKIFDESQPI